MNGKSLRKMRMKLENTVDTSSSSIVGTSAAPPPTDVSLNIRLLKWIICLLLAVIYGSDPVSWNRILNQVANFTLDSRVMAFVADTGPRGAGGKFFSYRRARRRFHDLGGA